MSEKTYEQQQEISERDFDYTHEEGGEIKCKNYELCESVIPKWWFDCKGKYLCTNCDIAFGTWGTQKGKGILEINDNIECPICIERKKCISYPRCNHMACIECFKRCMYGEETKQPIFPYPDIEDEYEEEPENPKWKKDYPLIEIYQIEYDNWEDDENKKYENETNLRLCPICRS